jgi:hypothetical protein
MQESCVASIQLTREEAELGFLPDVCMRCGAPATVRKRRLFVSHPLWVYVLLPFGYLPYVIVAAILTQRVRCYTHFCPRHKSHWLFCGLIIWGAFPVLLALIASGWVVVFSMEKVVSKSMVDGLAGTMCVGEIVLILLWLMSIPIMQLTAIHPADVTERRLTLKRVSPAFVEALRDYRDRPRADEEQEDYRRTSRPRRSEPSQDVYDPERPLPARPDPEAFQKEG